MALHEGSDAGIGSKAAKGGGAKRGTVTNLHEAAQAGDVTALAALERIVKTHEQQLKAQQKHDKVMEETKEEIAAAEGAFRNELNLGTEANASLEDHAARLRSIEELWGAYNKVVEDAKSKRDQAKSKLKNANQAFLKALEAGRQPELFPDLV